MVTAANKHDLYMNAYSTVINTYLENPKQDLKPLLKKLIFLGVKVVITKKEEALSKELIEYDFKYVDLIKSMIAGLTPSEFVSIFPIRKDYDGARWQVKDYFYTRDYIRKLDPNKPIGKEIDTFLWEYNNRDISMFVVNMMGIASNLRRLETGIGLMEEWAENNNLPIYKMHTDHKGKQYLIDKNTGRTMKVKSPKPKYLKVIR